MLLSRGVIEKDLLGERDDRRCGLPHLELAENVTNIVRRSVRLLGDESENMLIANGNLRVRDLHAPAVIVGIEAAVGDGSARIMLAEEKLTRVVGQCNSLLRDLEMNFSWCWQWASVEQHSDCFANSLRSRQRLGVGAKQVQDVASGTLRHKLLLCRRREISLLDVTFWKAQTTWQSQRCD